jgi:hypothetical protein
MVGPRFERHEFEDKTARKRHELGLANQDMSLGLSRSREFMKFA